ncbi:hypothetical protein CBR_g12993 [Chara braunii]|uniref:Reverse transcriptase/retrotransposon-derived protein RNase H-like domain-containing protein n=1 Tax=Chara braunii TaxID=69332 RepID=A0A388KT82_CHABU|nr:hypothetical protein CBR_g12993 [Chara braunii]|eukprot:GBG73274.1 hypothetical protein CBR_g12993 [Chara braunii]
MRGLLRRNSQPHASATSAVPCQQCHVSSATSAAVPRQQQCHVNSATSAPVPRQQCHVTMPASALGMLGQLAGESIVEFHKRILHQLAQIEAEQQRQAEDDADRLQAEAKAASSPVPRQQQCPVRMSASALGMLGQLADESIVEFRKRIQDQLPQIEAEEQHQAEAEAARLKRRQRLKSSGFRPQLTQIPRPSELENQHQELENLRQAVQNDNGLHEDATRALHTRAQDLEQAAPRADARKPSNAASTRQLEQRLDHVLTMLGDINTFAAPATISEQLGTLKTEIRQLQQPPANDGSTGAPRQYKDADVPDRELRQAKYKANRDKCEFVWQELEYLGHYVTPQGICQLEDKIEGIRVWPEPTNTTDVRSFMGLAGYYQGFITEYSRTAAPLTRLQSPKKPFAFDDEARQSFQALKTVMVMAPVLSIYNPTLPTRVTIDASVYGIGAVLEQHDGDDWHPVDYFSHKVSPINSLDDARKKELLVFVMALKRWRRFLLGRRRFTWVTDNNWLTYYKTQDTVSGTIGQWMYFIDQFDFTPKLFAGLSNCADPIFAP